MICSRPSFKQVRDLKDAAVMLNEDAQKHGCDSWRKLKENIFFKTYPFRTYALKTNIVQAAFDMVDHHAAQQELHYLVDHEAYR